MRYLKWKLVGAVMDYGFDRPAASLFCLVIY